MNQADANINSLGAGNDKSAHQQETLDGKSCKDVATRQARKKHPSTGSEGKSETTSQKEGMELSKRAKNHKKWNRRLKIFFCCLGYKKNKDSIGDVASIFAEFYADLNIASSDFAAGFVLLSKYQEAQRQWIVRNKQYAIEQYLSSVPITPQTRFLDISTANDSHLINDLIYYLNYSLAIFGWPMQVIDDPCMLCCIYPYLKPSFCCGGGNSEQICQSEDKTEKQQSDKKGQPAEVKRKTGQLDADCDRPIVLEDNCCGCNVASMERRLAAHNYEIIYVNYKVNVNMVPFLVAADHSKQSIVVALRGSMSPSDMVTDMNGQIDRLPIDNCPDDWLCHRGITKAANYVKNTLQEEHILERAFNCRPDLGSNDYTLILCGHSLGAGAAAILGILMQKDYPSLKAFLYSPPGGILSLPVVEYTKRFATGIILGNDFIPRLGVAQLERLRYQVLLSLKSSRKSSGRILAKAVCPTCCFGSNEVEYEPSLSLNLLHGTEGRSFQFNGSKIPFQVQPQVLYVPGRLIHIVKNHSFRSRAGRLFNEPIYQAVWTDNIDYDRIMISEGMFYDHLPNNLMHAMKMLFSKTLPARKESKLSSKRHSVDKMSEYCTPQAPGAEERDAIRIVAEDLQHKLKTTDDNNNSQLDDNNNEVAFADKNHQIDSYCVNDNSKTSKKSSYASETFDNISRHESHPKGDDESTQFDSNGNDETLPDNNRQ